MPPPASGERPSGGRPRKARIMAPAGEVAARGSAHWHSRITLRNFPPCRGGVMGGALSVGPNGPVPSPILQLARPTAFSLVRQAGQLRLSVGGGILAVCPVWPQRTLGDFPPVQRPSSGWPLWAAGWWAAPRSRGRGPPACQTDSNQIGFWSGSHDGEPEAVIHQMPATSIACRFVARAVF